MTGEARKLIKFGEATFCITLPKEWVRRHGLSKGATLQVRDDGTGALVVRTEAEAPRTLREKTIEIGRRPLEEIKRAVISAYINDYATINLEGEIRPTDVEGIRRILHELIALEILEIGPNGIIAKAFTEATDTKIPKVIERIEVILRSMLSDALAMVERGSIDPEAFRQNDFEINRLCFFATKVILRTIGDPGLAQRMEMRPAGLVFAVNVVDKLEKIGDRLKAAMTYLAVRDGTDLREIGRFLRQLRDNFDRAMRAYYHKDQKLANRVVDDCAMLYQDTEELAIGVRTKRAAVAIESLRRIITLSKDIGEVALDVE